MAERGSGARREGDAVSFQRSAKWVQARRGGGRPVAGCNASAVRRARVERCRAMIWPIVFFLVRMTRCHGAPHRTNSPALKPRRTCQRSPSCPSRPIKFPHTPHLRKILSDFLTSPAAVPIFLAAVSSAVRYFTLAPLFSSAPPTRDATLSLFVVVTIHTFPLRPILVPCSTPFTSTPAAPGASHSPELSNSNHARHRRGPPRRPRLAHPSSRAFAQRSASQLSLRAPTPHPHLHPLPAPTGLNRPPAPTPVLHPRPQHTLLPPHAQFFRSIVCR